MTEWKITGNRVHGKGQRYNCTNTITAQKLHQTLTLYEKTTQQYHETEKKLDKITKILIQLQMTNTIQTHGLETLKEALQ